VPPARTSVETKPQHRAARSVSKVSGGRDLAHLLKQSRRGALACALALALALVTVLTPAARATPSAAAENSDPLALLGRTAIAAIGSAGANAALQQVAENLALLAAQERIAEHAEREVRELEEQAESAVPDYSDIEDPSELPPASAGTNGTEHTLSSKAKREAIFARTPANGDPESTSILLTGIALPPPNAPEVVKDVINNANLIVGRPYIWGGGHGSFYSYGYDCSGAVSFALFGGGLIPRPATSGELEGYGEPGPGKWITIYANATHTWATIAGLRWDTSGTERGTGPRWHIDTRPTEGFVVRHPPGL
jgi:cell wall-associated NlpC family hydrolase